MSDTTAQPSPLIGHAMFRTTASKPRTRPGSTKPTVRPPIRPSRLAFPASKESSGGSVQLPKIEEVLAPHKEEAVLVQQVCNPVIKKALQLDKPLPYLPLLSFTNTNMSTMSLSISTTVEDPTPLLPVSFAVDTSMPVIPRAEQTSGLAKIAIHSLELQLGRDIPVGVDGDDELSLSPKKKSTRVFRRFLVMILSALKAKKTSKTTTESDGYDTETTCSWSSSSFSTLESSTPCPGSMSSASHAGDGYTILLSPLAELEDQESGASPVPVSLKDPKEQTRGLKTIKNSLFGASKLHLYQDTNDVQSVAHVQQIANVVSESISEVEVKNDTESNEFYGSSLRRVRHMTEEQLRDARLAGAKGCMKE